MRISTSSFVENMSNNIKQCLKQYQDIQNRISAGGQMLYPSDDPLAYSYINKLKDARNQINQYSQIAKKMENDLDFYETTLTEAVKLLRDIRTITLRASNSTVDDIDRKNLAQEVNTKLEQLISIGNSNIQGKYMYAGSRNLEPPYEVVRTGTDIIDVKYVGNSTELYREVGFNDKIRVNYHGEEVFSNRSGVGIDIFKEIISLKDDIIKSSFNKISSHLDNIDKAINQVLSVRTLNANSVRHLTNLQIMWSNLEIRYAKNMEEVGVLDMGSLINALNNQAVVYQATLYIAGTIGRISLLNYLH